MEAGSLFRNRNYLLLLTGQWLSGVGANVYSFALLWDMKVLTGNTVLMSLVGIGWALPQVVCGPLSGVIVDRMNKRTVMLASDAIRFAVTAAVTLLACRRALTPAEIIAAAFLSNMVASAFNPAAGAITPLLVAEEQLPAANGLGQAVGPLSMIIGPAISAALIAWIGVTGSFGLNALTYLVSVGTLSMMRAAEPEKVNKPWSMHQFMLELKDGWRALAVIRLLVVLIPAGLLLNFSLSPIDLYIVQYITVAMHRTQVALGEFNSSFAIGMMAGAVLMGPVNRLMRSGYVMAGGLLLLGLAVFGVSLTHRLWLAFAFACIAGAGMSIANVTIFTLVQATVPKAAMGRVLSLIMTVFGAATPLGMLVGGGLATIVPIRVLLGTVGGVIAVIAACLVTMPVIRATVKLGAAPRAASIAARGADTAEAAAPAAAGAAGQEAGTGTGI